MSCYKPMLGRFQGYNDSGKPSYKIDGTLWIPDQFLRDPRDIRIPCGHCVGCRLDYSRQWADRMVVELDHSKTAIFVTLTYDDEHLPSGFSSDYPEMHSLDKRDFQLFLKRLRRHFGKREIRYYLSGEYGSLNLRPHGHAIIFGLGLCDFPDLTFVKMNHCNQPIYTSQKLFELWDSRGFVSIASVSWQTCAYVARYATKKLEHAGIDYDSLGLLKEFSMMSLKPGIGGYFYDDHPDAIGDTRIYCNDPNGVREVNSVFLPKYLLNKLEFLDEDVYNSIVEMRRDASDNRLLMELRKSDLDEMEYLDGKLRVTEKKLDALKRL